MKITSIVYVLCQNQNHSLFIDDMVSSFHRKMLKEKTTTGLWERMENSISLKWITRRL